MLLAVLGFVMLIGLLILIRTCCYNYESYKSHAMMVSQQLHHRQIRQRQQVLVSVISDHRQPPSYEEAIKLPPFSSARLHTYV
jgi:hypothetical protein